MKMENQEQTGINYYRSIIRFNSQIFGLIFGLLLGLLIFIVTIWMVFKKDPEMSAFLQLLEQFLPGYSVSFYGSLIGSIYGFAIGSLFGTLIDRTYKLFVKLRMIRSNSILVRLLFGKKVNRVKKESLFSSVYWINSKVLGLECGLIIGLLIFIATNYIVIKGGHVTPGGEYVIGPHLQLLSRFFIGYSVSFSGSIIGFVYGFALGALSGVMLGWIYNSFVNFIKPEL